MSCSIHTVEPTDEYYAHLYGYRDEADYWGEDSNSDRNQERLEDMWDRDDRAAEELEERQHRIPD